MASETHAPGYDPCGEFGPTQRWALVWFIGVLLGGSALVAVLASIDNRMYTSGAEFIDWNRYRQNRTASTTIGAERIDPRTVGDIATARTRVEREGPR